MSKDDNGEGGVSLYPTPGGYFLLQGKLKRSGYVMPTEQEMIAQGEADVLKAIDNHLTAQRERKDK